MTTNRQAIATALATFRAADVRERDERRARLHAALAAHREAAKPEPVSAQRKWDIRFLGAVVGHSGLSASSAQDVFKELVNAKVGQPVTAANCAFTIERDGSVSVRRGGSIEGERREGAAAPVLKLVPTSNANDERYMSGYAAVFGQWARIVDSSGPFMESVAPSAFDSAFQPSSRQILALFNHGKDPNIGDKPLGPVSLSRDLVGLRYSVELLDAHYVRELRPAVANGLFGSSFRFAVMADSWAMPSKATSRNPERLPERVLRDVILYEVGPCSFPAYQAAGPVGLGRSENVRVRELAKA